MHATRSVSALKGAIKGVKRLSTFRLLCYHALPWRNRLVIHEFFLSQCPPPLNTPMSINLSSDISFCMAFHFDAMGLFSDIIL